MLRRRSISIHAASIAAVSVLSALSAGCMSEYDFEQLEDPLNLCTVGCEIERPSYWHNPNEASQVGFSVEIAAWGYQTTGVMPQPTVYSVDKNKRTAFGG